jgi:hypothetical protein
METPLTHLWMNFELAVEKVNISCPLKGGRVNIRWIPANDINDLETHHGYKS